MKYWEVNQPKYKDLIPIAELNAEDGDRTLLISKEKNGNIRFTEGCDEYFFVELSKEDTIEALNELIEWIKL